MNFPGKLSLLLSFWNCSHRSENSFLSSLQPFSVFFTCCIIQHSRGLLLLSFFFFSLNLYSRFLAVIQIRVLLFLEVLPSVGLSWLFQLFFPWLSLASSYPGPCVSQPFFICFSVILSSVNWLFLINLVSTLVWWFNSSPQLLECHLCVSSQRTPSFVWPTVTSEFSFKFLKQWGDWFDCVVNGPK